MKLYSVLFASILGALSLSGCISYGLRPAVVMTLTRDQETPKGALVYVDEQYLGTLSYVAARGVKLPEGEHRVTVEKAGYFPFDTIVVSDRDPIKLDVKLERLPD